MGVEDLTEQNRALPQSGGRGQISIINKFLYDALEGAGALGKTAMR